MAHSPQIQALADTQFRILETYWGDADVIECWEHIEHHCPGFDPTSDDPCRVNHAELEPVTVTLQHIKGTAFYLLPV